MFHKLDPLYNMPSRKYFSKTALPAMYEECRGRVQMEFYASTADMWSSRATEPYISLYGPLHKEGLEFEQLLHPDKFFPDTHMGENITSGLKQFLQEWNLDEEKQVFLTTDCGANIVKAVTLNMWTRLSSLAIVYTLLFASLLFLS